MLNWFSGEISSKDLHLAKLFNRISAITNFMNMPNFEFIKNRSFEIAWAIFRCAALIRQNRIKKELEEGAVNLVSKYGDSGVENNNLDSLKNFSEIQKLNSVIKLAEAIGEIKIVNARVLYRELNNLSDEVKASIKYFEEEMAKQSNREVSIEDIFEESSINQNNNKASNQMSSASNEFAVKQPISSAMSAASRQIITRQNPMQLVRQNTPKVELAVAVNQKLNVKSVKKTAVESDEDSIQDSWQNLIYRKIKEFGKTSTREISAFFPEISERTVRFYLQKLSDSGMIEKIGTTGPGSYYMFKK